MLQNLLGSLAGYLSQVVDPRKLRGRRHSLVALLTAVICGLLCGARGYESLVEWLHALPVEFWHKIGFTRRPPKKDCFRDLLIKLDPDAFQLVVNRWINDVLKLELKPEDLQVFSIDGKVLCNTLTPFADAVKLLAAVDHATGYVLHQLRVPSETNEHKTALVLLESMVLEGKVVVGDAAFCQRDVCQQVLANKGEYLLPVKENQADLRRQIAHEFAADEAAFSPLLST
jgi:hypothetical protein